MKRLCSLFRERAGSVTVELALVAPILAAMLIGLIDISTAYSDKLKLEQIAQRTIEKVMQKSFTTADVDGLETEAEAAAGTGANATVTYWLECDAVKMTGDLAYATGCTGTQQYARYVQIVLTKTHSPMIISAVGGASTSGNITLTATSGIRIQ